MATSSQLATLPQRAEQLKNRINSNHQLFFGNPHSQGDFRGNFRPLLLPALTPISDFNLIEKFQIEEIKLSCDTRTDSCPDRIRLADDAKFAGPVVDKL